MAEAVRVTQSRSMIRPPTSMHAGRRAAAGGST